MYKAGPEEVEPGAAAAVVGSIIEGLTIYISSKVICLISKLLMNGLARQDIGQF